MMEMERRRAATQATMDRYRNRVFDWAKGVTCAHMARFHLRKLGAKVPAMPRFRSAIGAQKAMKAHGWADCVDMLDDVLERLPSPAFATLGDIIIIDGEGMDAILICTGPLRFFGWVEGDELPKTAEIDLNNVKGAWRG